MNGVNAKIITKCMLEETAAKKIDLVPLSNNTGSCGIYDLSSDVESELLKGIKLTYFIVANATVLLVYVRYVFKNLI